MLRKIPYDTSTPILARFRLSDEAAKVISENMAPDLVLKALHKGKHFVDLIHFFGHAMPPREGVCWALSVIKDLQPEVSEADAAVCAQVGDWVRDPQETRRIALMQEGEKRENEDPIGWLCNAVAWNGSGSIGPVDGPTVLPPAGLYVTGLLGAISLLAGDTEDTFSTAVEVSFQRGMTVAQGGWPNIAT